MNKSLTDFSCLFYLNSKPSWIYDFETLDILDVNEAAITLLGYSKKDFLTLKINELIVKEEIAAATTAVAENFNQHINIFSNVYSLKKKSGKIITMQIKGYKANFSDKKVIIAEGQKVAKITNEFEVNKKTDKSDVFFTLNNTGSFVYVSASSKNHCGYLPEELIGKSYLDLILEGDKRTANRTFDNILSGQDVTSSVIHFRKKKMAISSINYGPQHGMTSQTLSMA